jgi:hypothetical protein
MRALGGTLRLAQDAPTFLYPRSVDGKQEGVRFCAAGSAAFFRHAFIVLYRTATLDWRGQV